MKNLVSVTVIDNQGIVLCGHCTCIAGLGEVCSHIGAVLFTVEAWGVNLRIIQMQYVMLVTTFV